MPPHQEEHAGGPGPAPPKRRWLAAHHWQHLRDGGIRDESIDHCGLYTAAGEEVRRLLGWLRSAANLGPCLVIPYFTPAGEPTGFARVRPDNPRFEKSDGRVREVKYEQPIGLPVRPYFPPLPSHLRLLDDQGETLLVTEGEKKAIAAAQAGFAVVGLPGVDCWSVRRRKGKNGRKLGKRRLHPDLAALIRPGRRVAIVYDSDISWNLDVRRAAEALAEAVRRLGRRP
jgi:hypothetical protein